MTCGRACGRNGGKTGLSQWAERSRGDRPELLLGDATVESGLDGGPSVSDGCLGVVRVDEQVFDELLCMVARSSSGLKDEWGQVDAYLSNFFASSRSAV